jgi:glucokinase
VTAEAAGADVVAAVDIGGTKTAAAIVDREGVVRARATVPTPSQDGPEAILDAVARVIGELGSSPQAVGIGSAGVVDPVSGLVLGATDVLRDWAGTDLRGGLVARLGLPVAVANDVHAHGLGEARYGAGRGHDSVLTIAVGTGIGGAFVSGGRLLTGPHAAAGHVGHVPSAAAELLLCTCGATGHLEGFAAGPALVREFARRGGEAVDGLESIARYAAEDDVRAVGVLRDGGAAVGSVIGGLVNVLDPAVVVVGGGVAAVGGIWWDALLDAAAREVMPLLADVPIERSTFGGDAALLGAAALAWEAE